MAYAERLICDSTTLQDGGPGLRFTVNSATSSGAAFAIRFQGFVYAYVNRCAHRTVELDWQEGEFFDDSRLYLICATHGAMYKPTSGDCAGGPCRGRSLEALKILERNGKVYFLAERE